MSTDRQLKTVPAARPLRVLLVEDNPDDAFMLERHLRRAGFVPQITQVETASAMRSALAQCGEQWQIILADYNLPAFSAPEALRLLKSTEHDIPFIMMSGAISEETAVAAMRAGAQDYVSKQNLARLVPAIEREIAEAETRHSRRVAERALRTSEERFHHLVEAMPLGLLISGADGRILYANTAIERLLGYSRQDFSSGAVTLERIFAASPEKPGLLTEDWSGGSSQPVEIECLTQNGARVTVLVGAAVLNPEAPREQRQVAAFLADMTEQKRSHDVLRRTEKLAAAGRLAASIAHEINNPLESVTNCLYLLEQGTMDSDSRRYLALAQQELDRVTHMTTQTLRFYRQNTRPVATDVRELFDTVLALYDARIRGFGIHVVREFDEIPRITVFDGGVRQVLANLVGNAVDAMQSSGGRLLLRTRCARDWANSRPGISITVADTGSGMDRSTQSRIFEAFFSTKGLTGTGLGLWVSQDIIAKHRGAIQVRSRQGTRSGTVFRIFLPIQPAEAFERDEPFLAATA